MTEKNILDNHSDFVVSHFKDDYLLPDEGWRRFKLTNHIPFFKRNVVAASVAAIVLAASASIYYYSKDSQPETEDISLQTTLDTTTARNKIEKIEFHDASLKDVVAEIERVYNVSIANVPASDIRVNISYEGTAQDVVETINELLDTNLEISSGNNNNKK